MGKIQENYKKARKYLHKTQNKIAELAGISSGVVTGLESGSVKNPNYQYTKYLVKQGVNPFYLLNLSDKINGEKLEDFVPKAEHEKLKAEFEDLLHEHKTLQNVLKILQIEVDEDGNVKKKI